MSTQEFIFEYKDYPLIPIKFYFNGKETPFIDALLDSGGDFIVIPMAIAQYLGLKLIKSGDVIYTHCHSTNVTNALIYAKNKGKMMALIGKIGVKYHSALILGVIFSKLMR